MHFDLAHAGDAMNEATFGLWVDELVKNEFSKACAAQQA
jgi:hypothetical protein